MRATCTSYKIPYYAVLPNLLPLHAYSIQMHHKRILSGPTYEYVNRTLCTYIHIYVLVYTYARMLIALVEPSALRFRT
jgi:hypothetical protein